MPRVHQAIRARFVESGDAAIAEPDIMPDPVVECIPMEDGKKTVGQFECGWYGLPKILLTERAAAHLSECCGCRFCVIGTSVGVNGNHSFTPWCTSSCKELTDVEIDARLEPCPNRSPPYQ